MSTIAFLIVFTFLLFNHSVEERTRKASKSAVEKIKKIFNEKATQRALAQNDAALMADDPRREFGPRRDPTARRHHDELAVNGADGDYFEGDLELAEWQAERLWHKLGEAKVKRRRKKRKIAKVNGKRGKNNVFQNLITGKLKWKIPGKNRNETTRREWDGIRFK
ncbi:hypothetical protein niasHT_020568 [Heterodera trifolii]|uniref:Uncharacterized protein n=1 Tax=Heterodera trifolii TaxID=157864 RepID=A0ABD2J9R6_9BILA